MTGAVVAANKARSIPQYAISTGTNFAILGCLFSSFRAAGHFVLPPVTGDKVKKRMYVISGTAGAMTGAAFASIPRNPRGHLVSMLSFGIWSVLGEFTYQSVVEAATAVPKPVQKAQKVAEQDKSVWRKLKESSPLRSIPDDEFRALMEGKIRHLDESIAAINEEIVYTKTQIQGKQASKIETQERSS